ncbi:hypothetical protein ELZ19_06670 [Brucella abortus]|uniref:phage tail assembly chaperone n=1 Tax=Brucella abortus TaxID=235 RepID=UPI0004E8E548|nr:hypothetical protein [Brucella abortus]KFH18437.1 hypothetical protein IB60_17160 [Brucella abortus LMN1]RUQ67333.1 hypothetical protein ELZ23_15505 [Brucella abortus]RUQ78144.1 hypothetical protein ELZ22_17355 [Brucella abortus]RUQ88280.1 hypothetical protein ELZ18_15575 [Brucella abortus]RUQ90309.1 hypothetical protein ELZ20_15570 [Brucella abortus]
MNEPEIVPADEFYLRAFFELNTGRTQGFGAPGSIPWRDIVAYAEYAGLDEDVKPAFVSIIRALDAEYLKWMDEERERKRRLAETARDGDTGRHRRAK